MRGAADAAHPDAPVFEVRQIFDLLRCNHVVGERVDQSHDDRFAGAGRVRYDRRSAGVVGDADFSGSQRLRGKAAALDEQDFDVQPVLFKETFLFGYPEKGGAGTHGRVTQPDLFLGQARDCERSRERTQQNGEKKFRTKSRAISCHDSIPPI